MPVVEQVPMSRTTITIVALLLLCAAVVAYSQGWFNWSSSGYETGSNEVGTEQRIDQENTNEDVAHVTQPTSEPAVTLTE